ncbi:spindle assembly abnormal protein 6-like [Nyctibius grandis]|uniref:spindle assembly abnormal protein 6-like n=1 Tax=Nyctibius grandis TaxID=48427 RepID=UPI0035BC41C2
MEPPSLSEMLERAIPGDSLLNMSAMWDLLRCLVGRLHLLFPEGDQESMATILAKLQGQVSELQGQGSELRDQVSQLQGLASELEGEKEKSRQLEDAVAELRVAAAQWRAEGSEQLRMQVGSTLEDMKREVAEQREVAKAMLEDMKREVAEQREVAKAMLEEMKRVVAEQREVAKQQELTKATLEQLQKQLDELRAVVESAGQEQPGAQAACPTCSGDSGAQVRQLLQRYEELRGMVQSMLRLETVKVARQLPVRSQIGSWQREGLGRGLPGPPRLVVLGCSVGEPLAAPQIGLYG